MQKEVAGGIRVSMVVRKGVDVGCPCSLEGESICFGPGGGAAFEVNVLQEICQPS